MQQPIHHDHIGRPEPRGDVVVKLAAVERADRTEAVLRVINVSVIDVDPVVPNTGRKMTHDKARTASDIDHMIAGFERKIGLDRTHSCTEESAGLLETLINLRMS